MATPGGESTTTERAFSRALRDLHRHAGGPSSRAVAIQIGGMSHTTVNSALKGTKIPSWPITAKIVEALGGDLSEFQRLWIATREDVENEKATLRSEVSVFVSYARVDDDATHGRVSQLVKDVGNAYESLTGKTVGVFLDINSIAPGEDWKDRIRLGLSSSSIFLAVVSPAFLRSAHCREELGEFFGFLDANSNTRLVVPLLYTDRARIDRTFSNDALWRKIAQRQPVDISGLRFTDVGSSEWMRRTTNIAETIEDILGDEPLVESSEDDGKSAVGRVAESEGLFERFAQVEERAPEIGNDLEQFATLLNELGEKTAAATPGMQKATSFGQKLAVTNSLAAALSPIAAKMNETAERIVDNFTEWDSLINYAISNAKVDPAFLEDPGTIEFISTVQDMANAGIESLRSVDQLSDSVGQVLGMSKRLDVALRAVREACLHMADLRGLLSGWKSELEDLESTNPKAFNLPTA